MRIKEGVIRGLCGQCQNAIVRQDEGASEPVVTCMAYYGPSRDINKPVESCSSFEARGKNTLEEMKRVAWILEVKKGKPMGFKNPDEAKEMKLVTD